MKTLVAYFSASGITKSVAEKIAKSINADLFEIEPKEPYTKQDLDWMDPNSRSTIEMKDKSSRPKIAKKVSGLKKYDTILVGFPVWWYTAPTIINTFLEGADFSGKTIIPFCTSGGSGITQCQEDLESAYPNYTFKQGKHFNASDDENIILNWLKQ